MDTKFVFDYALVFNTSTGLNWRIDMTIIPKVFRYANADPASTLPPPSAFLCRPDGKDTEFSMSPAVKDYIPQSGNCTAGGRSAPYARISYTYAVAHPEEEEWLQKRLAVTGPEVRHFVKDHLGPLGYTLSPAEARLKIAVVHSGGGKRAMLQSLGTCG